MMIINTKQPANRRQFIPCQGGGFQLVLRLPTYAERLEDKGLQLQFFASDEAGKAYARQMQRRLEVCAIGWYGVLDEAGKEVPFTVSALIGLLTLHPDAAEPVSTELNELYREDVAALGKSAEPPKISGEIKRETAGPMPSDSTQNSVPSETAAAN